MIYTEDFAFIHVPKTSGVSIKKSIEKNCSDAVYVPTNTFNNQKYHSETFNDDWRRVMHYPYSYWEPMLEDKWVFSVVRNPYVRAVSFYVFFKTIYASKERHVDLTFEQMYTKTYWTKKYGDRLGKFPKINIQTMTQTETLTGLNGLVPNVFKYEDGYSEIEKKLGFQIDERENITPKYNYLDYYDEKRQKQILNFFEEDFENFSYDEDLK